MRQEVSKILLALALYLGFCVSAFAGSILGWGAGKIPDGNFVALAEGAYHSLALKSDGSIVGWGYNDYGQATPPDGNDFLAISAGAYHSLALKSDGSIVGWGYNYFGQATPPDGNDFLAISAGGLHSLALKSDGTIVGWGNNYDWNGNWVGQATPPDGNNYIAISAGWQHSLALIGQPCLYVLAGDLNDDCRVDFYDFAKLASNWLIDCRLDPDNPKCLPK